MSKREKKRGPPKKGGSKPKSAKKKNPPKKGGGGRKGGFNAVSVGKSVGGLFGPAGSALGGAAGALFRNITGYGDYKVDKNSLAVGDSLPTFASAVRGTRIMHREYLQDVITSSNVGQFHIDSYLIQPALGESFPWLSALAENYEEYTINGMVFEFKSNSYDALASTNTASGTVVMTTQYNVYSPIFPSKLPMEQYQYTCSDKPSRDLLHPVECAHPETPTTVLQTRSSPVVQGDQRLYDWGRFNIATVGMQGASTNIGELWVTYDITMFKPKIGPTVDVYDHYQNLTGGDMKMGGPAYFGSPNHVNRFAESDYGSYLSGVNGTALQLDTINIPAGTRGSFVVIIGWDGTSAAVNSLSASLTYNVSGTVASIGCLAGGDSESSYGGNLVYNGNGLATSFAFFSCTDGGAITLTGGTNGGVQPVALDLFVIAIPSPFI